MFQNQQHPQTIQDNTEQIDLSQQIIIFGSIKTPEQCFDNYTQYIYQIIKELVDENKNLEDVQNKLKYFDETIQQMSDSLKTNINMVTQKQIEQLILQAIVNQKYKKEDQQLKVVLYIRGNQEMTFFVEKNQNPYIILWCLENGDNIFQKIKNSDKKYLIKIINLEKIETQKFFNQEQLGKFNEYCKNLNCIQNSDHIYCLEMEFSQTNLEEMIQLKNKEGNKFSFNEVLEIFNNCAQGLQELYELNILHRNLQPKNILIVNNIAKISDFRLSIEKEMQQESGFSSYQNPYGALEINIQQRQDINLDMNSLGHIFKQLMEVSENNLQLNFIIEQMVQVNTQLTPKELCCELQKLCQPKNIELE